MGDSMNDAANTDRDEAVSNAVKRLEERIRFLTEALIGAGVLDRHKLADAADAATEREDDTRTDVVRADLRSFATEIREGFGFPQL